MRIKVKHIEVDKVYARIISVSLLLSLCGAGMVGTGVCRAFFLTEAEPALVRKAFASQLPFTASRKCVDDHSTANTTLKRFLSSITKKIAGMCARRNITTQSHCNPGNAAAQNVDASPVSVLPLSNAFAGSDYRLTLCQQAAAVCRFESTAIETRLAIKVTPIRAGPQKKVVSGSNQI